MKKASREEEGTFPEEAPPSFSGLGLAPDRLAAVEAEGWERPTPIQVKAIPSALEGKDVVGIAQTGTGKTGAFVLPSLERIEPGRGLQLLVLCPTRELAQQVAEDAESLARGSTLRVGVVVGGVSYGPQEEALREGFEVIAATPGRFNDHMSQGRVDLSGLRVLVLDEADRMLDMGFRPQIEDVLRKSPSSRQTMLFSATMPNGVHALALRVTREAVWVEAAPGTTTAEGITERVYPVKPERKPELLVELLGEAGWDQVLVFTRTKAGADALKSRLEREGLETDVMHGDRHMKERTRALDRFASGAVRVLVATDVAQRGLDVEGISHVVNYDVPLDPEDYVHRIGRTARAGAVGTAVTFVTAGDFGHLKSIERLVAREIPRVHKEGYDYGGGEVEDGDGGRDRGKHARSTRGVGSKDPSDLSPEELEKLLNP